MKNIYIYANIRLTSLIDVDTQENTDEKEKQSTYCFINYITDFSLTVNRSNRPLWTACLTSLKGN